MQNKINDYLNYILCEKRLSINTYNNYKLDLECFQNYFKKASVYTMVENDIIKYLEYLKKTKKLTPRSIERHLSTLKEFFRYLKKMEIIKNDIFKNVGNLKIGKHLPVVLTVEEVEDLLDIKLNTVFDYRTKAMLEIMYGSGLRVSELVNLTLNDIDFYENLIIIRGKGSKERIVPLGDYAREYLIKYLDMREDLIKDNSDNLKKLFLNNHGKPITRNGLNFILNNLLREKGIDKKVTPHTLRHCFASHMIDNGADLKIIQELLGHSNVETTRLYIHMSTKKIKENYDKYQIREKIV